MELKTRVGEEPAAGSAGRARPASLMDADWRGAGVLQAPWWQCARLADGANLPNGVGVYCIYEHDADEPVYIGEASALLARSATHAAGSWSLSEPWLAVLPLADGTPKYVLHELEGDLLGWHFWRTGRAPVFQYRKAPGAGDNAA